MCLYVAYATNYERRQRTGYKAPHGGNGDVEET